MNPRGRPSAGASIIEWYNIMANWQQRKVRLVFRDRDEVMAKRIAAARMLGAILEPDECEIICDRTEGKPGQRLTMAVTGEVRVRRFVEGEIVRRQLTDET